MEYNYYNVSFVTSVGNTRTVEDVKAYAPDEAVHNATVLKDNERLVIQLDEITIEIFKNHLVEIIVEEVPSPEERSKQINRSMDIYNRM